MSDLVPLELQQKIMETLPVKSLLRFRSVSKTWMYLIDSTEFMAAHSFNRLQPQRILVRYKNSQTTMDNFVSILDNESFPQMEIAPLPFEALPYFFYPKIVGISQGLVCMYGLHGYSDKTMLVIWNPAIRKWIAIALPQVFPKPYGRVVGFAVCPVNSDPIILKLTLPKSTSRHWKADVYALSSGEWRSLTITTMLPSAIRFTSSQVVVDNLIYWHVLERIATDAKFRIRHRIVSFDTTNENFRMIDLPDNLAVNPTGWVSIYKLRESLVVLALSAKNGVTDRDVWMMDRGVHISFAKLFTIPSPYISMKTLGFRKCGELIMADAGDHKGVSELVVYEPNSKQVTGLGLRGLRCWFAVNSYTETLLLLRHPGCCSY